MRVNKRRWLVASLGVIVLVAAIGTGGYLWVKRRLEAGTARNFPPAAIAATQPVVPFDGQVDLVRGGTLRLIAIGSNDPQAQQWWTPQGKLTTQPQFADAPRHLPMSLGPANRVREVAWSLTERTAEDRNVSPKLDVVGSIASSRGSDGSTHVSQTQLYTVYDRLIFQRPDDAATFTVRGSIDDHQWQTFAVLTPNGPKQAGPINVEFAQLPDGRAQLSLTGEWAWPMRVVFVTTGGEASEARVAMDVRSPAGRSHQAASDVFLLSEVKEAHVQLCGQQRFEIRDLPSDPLATPRPATLVEDHLRPTVPGLPPLRTLPPPEISAKEFSRRYELFTPPATQPTTQPDASVP